MISLLLLSTVQAAKYECVQTTQLQELKSSRFQTHETGWVGATGDGLLRVYVGKSEIEAQQWVVSMKQQLYTHNFTTVENRGDEAYGDLENILLVRYSNVGLIAQGTNVVPWMYNLETLLIGPQEEWKSTCVPTVSNTPDGLYQITTKPDCTFNFIGGEPVYTENGLFFTKLPEQITMWDRCTRSTIWQPNYNKTSFTPRAKSLGSQPK